MGRDGGVHEPADAELGVVPDEMLRGARQRHSDPPHIFDSCHRASCISASSCPRPHSGLCRTGRGGTRVPGVTIRWPASSCSLRIRPVIWPSALDYARRWHFRVKGGCHLARDESSVGCVGVLIVGTRGADGPGEVLIKIRGGSEAFLDWSEKPLPRGATVLLIESSGARAVDVIEWEDVLGDTPRIPGLLLFRRMN